jgi:hypothetical protein
MAINLHFKFYWPELPNNFFIKIVWRGMKEFHIFLTWERGSLALWVEVWPPRGQVKQVALRGYHGNIVECEYKTYRGPKLLYLFFSLLGIYSIYFYRFFLGPLYLWTGSQNWKNTVYWIRHTQECSPTQWRREHTAFWKYQWNLCRVIRQKRLKKDSIYGPSLFKETVSRDFWPQFFS